MSTDLSSTRPAGHPGRTALVLGMTVALIAAVALGVLVLGDRSTNPPASSPATVTAQARAGTTSAELLQLEGQIVGPDAVVVPGERAPDIAAFHRAGVAAMSIDGSSLTVTLLADATQAQRDRVRSILEGSPLITRVSATGG